MENEIAYNKIGTYMDGIEKHITKMEAINAHISSATKYIQEVIRSHECGEYIDVAQRMKVQELNHEVEANRKLYTFHNNAAESLLIKIDNLINQIEAQ